MNYIGVVIFLSPVSHSLSPPFFPERFWLLYQRGHSKSTFARNFQFLTPFHPLLVLVRFTCAPPSTYVHFSELSPSLKKSSAMLINFRMKNRVVKRGKLNNFFVNSALKINVFYIVIYAMIQRTLFAVWKIRQFYSQSESTDRLGPPSPCLFSFAFSFIFFYLQVEDYQNILKLRLVFMSYKFSLKSKKRSVTSSSTPFSAWFFKQNISHVIFY